MDITEILETPENVQALLQKEVQIKTVDNEVHVGDLYVIDPQSKTIVLENKTSATFDIILHHAIRDFTVLSKDDGKFVLEEETNISNAIDFSEKKKKVKEWLVSHLIDVEEVGVTLKIDDHITIEPPYDLEQCYCSNTIILDKLRRLLEKMPD